MASPTLVFRLEGLEGLELEDEHLDWQQDDNILMLAHMRFLTKLCPLASKLQQDVERCVRTACPQAPKQLCCTADLAAALAARGYLVALHKSAGGGSGLAAFKNLRHTFITVALPSQAASPCSSSSRAGTAGSHHPHLQMKQGAAASSGSSSSLWALAAGMAAGSSPSLDALQPEEAAAGEEAEGGMLQLLVDPHFACQFTVACPSPRYAALLRVLPQTFVGTREQLEHVVEWACREMEWSFKHSGQALPPWRSHEAMLSKWQPQSPAGQEPSAAAGCCHGSGGSEAAAGDLPSASPPAPCCCHGAGAARAVAAAGAAAAAGTEPRQIRCCSGRRSPCSVLGGSGGATPRAGFANGGADAAQHAIPFSVSAPSEPSRRTSLLSRSLEAAGLRRSGSPAAHHQVAWQRQWGHAAGAEVAGDWWEPRVHVVRRSA